MSDLIFIPILIAWFVGVLVLSVPFPALYTRLVREVRTRRNAHASIRAIKRQVEAAESSMGDGTSQPT